MALLKKKCKAFLFLIGAEGSPLNFIKREVAEPHWTGGNVSGGLRLRAVFNPLRHVSVVKTVPEPGE